MRCCISILIGTLPALLATLSFAGETISEEEAWKLGWPAMQGPYGNYRVPQTGVKLVDDLSKAHLEVNDLVIALDVKTGKTLLF